MEQHCEYANNAIAKRKEASTPQTDAESTIEAFVGEDTTIEQQDGGFDCDNCRIVYNFFCNDGLDLASACNPQLSFKRACSTFAKLTGFFKRTAWRPRPRCVTYISHATKPVVKSYFKDATISHC